MRVFLGLMLVLAVVVGCDRESEADKIAKAKARMEFAKTRMEEAESGFAKLQHLADIGYSMFDEETKEAYWELKKHTEQMRADYLSSQAELNSLLSK